MKDTQVLEQCLRITDGFCTENRYKVMRPDFAIATSAGAVGGRITDSICAHNRNHWNQMMKTGCAPMVPSTSAVGGHIIDGLCAQNQYQACNWLCCHGPICGRRRRTCWLCFGSLLTIDTNFDFVYCANLNFVYCFDFEFPYCADLNFDYCFDFKIPYCADLNFVYCFDFEFPYCADLNFVYCVAFKFPYCANFNFPYCSSTLLLRHHQVMYRLLVVLWFFAHY